MVNRAIVPNGGEYMNKPKKDLKETVTELKELFTYQFPYWATILLIFAATSKDIPRLKFVLMLIIILVGLEQKFMIGRIPKWIILTLQILLTPLMLLFFFENEFRAIGQYFGW